MKVTMIIPVGDFKIGDIVEFDSKPDIDPNTGDAIGEKHYLHLEGQPKPNWAEIDTAMLEGFFVATQADANVETPAKLKSPK